MGRTRTAHINTIHDDDDGDDDGDDDDDDDDVGRTNAIRHTTATPGMILAEPWQCGYDTNCSHKHHPW